MNAKIEAALKDAMCKSESGIRSFDGWRGTAFASATLAAAPDASLFALNGCRRSSTRARPARDVADGPMSSRVRTGGGSDVLRENAAMRKTHAPGRGRGTYLHCWTARHAQPT